MKKYQGYWRANVGQAFPCSHVVWVPQPFVPAALRVIVCPGWLAYSLADLLNWISKKWWVG